MLVIFYRTFGLSESIFIFKVKESGAQTNLGDVAIVMDGNFRTVTVHFACFFEDHVKFQSDAYSIEQKEAETEGKIEVQGSWEDAFRLGFLIS